MNNTPFNNAFDFNSTIKPSQLSHSYSPKCIFCSCTQTLPLMSDGSFRSCTNCNKQFKAHIIQTNQNTLFQNNRYTQPLFPTMRPNFTPTKQSF